MDLKGVTEGKIVDCEEHKVSLASHTDNKIITSSS